MEHIDEILERNLPQNDLEFVRQLLYGPHVPRTLELSKRKNDIEIRGFSFLEPGCNKSDQECNKVRIGLFQNSIVEETSSPIRVQRDALLELGSTAVSTAGDLGVNVFCFQEIWNMPVAFCTQKKLPWIEFAEDAFTGPTTQALRDLAKKHSMVIISPILERDSVDDTLWNSAVVINDDGCVLGVSRKNHIPAAGRYSETYYYGPSEKGHPVFSTKYGKIGVAICYDRHHPHCWFSCGLNGAQIVFNPSATVKTFSEPLWGVETRDAAFQNRFYTCAINRVGLEVFSTEGGVTAGPFFGSSYVTAPDGSRTPGLSCTENALLIADVDLGKCQSVSPKKNLAGIPELFQRT